MITVCGDQAARRCRSRRSRTGGSTPPRRGRRRTSCTRPCATSARARSPACRCRSTCSTATTRCCRRRRSGPSSRACPSTPLPAKFTHGKKASVCLVYFAPDHGKLVAISFRPTQDFDAITWTGPLAQADEEVPRTDAFGGRTCAADNRGMSPLTLGSLTVPVPVVLAPMAGITNAAYRRLCAEQGAGLYVCEMITCRGLVERDSTTLKMLVFDELETTRSVQLYGTDPAYVGKATEILCAEYGVHHVDLNFGCPGAQGDPQGWRGSAAVEARAARRDPALRGRRRRAVRRAGHDEDPQGPRRRPPDLPRRRPDRAGGGLRRHRAARPDRRPVLQRSGRLGRRSPGSSSTSTSRSSATATSGRPADALRMVEQTGAAGVVVGRGCLGRPVALPRPRRRVRGSGVRWSGRSRDPPPSRPSARCA